ncbi:MAG: hypothetical protein QOG31_136 [Thermoplasmata archaeon]|jgi:hypothetical protein|nr:hypothetical protein [Thermoplasmata archaeon]
MSNARTIFLIALLGVAAAIPTASAASSPGITNPIASTPTKLYFHVGANQDFPINTQSPPTDGYVKDDHIGLATNSLSCAPAGTPADGNTQKRYTTYYGFSSPGYVEYNYTENGGPRIHPERGLSFDVNLDPAVAPVVYWYITTFTGQPPGSTTQGNNADPVIPNVVARATIRTGEKITLGDEGYNDGEIIAQGQTEPTTLVAGQKAVTAGGQDNPQVTLTPQGTGKATIYGFAIPLKYASTTIPKDKGYSVRVDLFMSLPTCDMSSSDAYIMPNVVQTHTDPQHRPHAELAVMNAVRIEYMHPQFVGDDMVIHTSENSPWGNYDVDETAGGINLEILGPNGQAVTGVYRAAVVQRYHEHDHHTQAVDVTFVWPYKQLNAQDGAYTISLEVKNDQGTQAAKGVALFQIGKDLTVTKCGGLTSVAGAETDQKCINERQDTNGNALTGPVKKSPNLELVGLLGAIGLVAVLVRRKD